MEHSNFQEKIPTHDNKTQIIHSLFMSHIKKDIRKSNKTKSKMKKTFIARHNVIFTTVTPCILFIIIGVFIAPGNNRTK